MTNASTYEFKVDADAASAATNRFRIVFKKAQVLPVTMVNIRAYQQNEMNAVEWKVANGINIIKYEIERSTEGNNFSTIGTIAVTNNSNPENQYQFLDHQPSDRNNFYRIKYFEAGGQWKYTAIVHVEIKRDGIVIYPNPIKDNIIHCQLYYYPLGKYTIKLVSQVGQSVYESTIQNNSLTSSYSISPKNYLVPGIYDLQITGEDNKTVTKKIIVSR